MDYLRIYNTIDSTNKEAHRLLAEGPVNKDFTLFAKMQTSGKGQFGRTWIAEPDAHLAMTIIHQPSDLTPSELPILNMKVCLGIVKALQAIHPGIFPFIKWPNDIYTTGKKLCGILIENSISGKKVQHSIIGIGMNVNESCFPLEIPNAVSLFMLTGVRYDLLKILNEIRSSILSLLSEYTIDWKTEYDQYLFGQHEWFSFEINENIIRAEVIQVSDEGKLVLRTEDQKIGSYYSHEVKWVM